MFSTRNGTATRSLPSSLPSSPSSKDIRGVVVESTYNWYWLVDALIDVGYRVHLANVSAIKQYEGLKQIDDKRSSLWLANLLRLNILPTCYIYPKAERLSWCTAKRDQSGITKDLAEGKDISEIYGSERQA
jgi:hypothetical protein